MSTTAQPTWDGDVAALFAAPYWIEEPRRAGVAKGWHDCMDDYGIELNDYDSDQGGRRSSFQRRILRRALPSGSPLPESGPDPAGGDRGLMFLCYQASIVDQFEFLNSVWMGDPIAPRSPGGHDMVSGQNGQPGEDRTRSCAILKPPLTGTVTATKDAVVPTAGGYFFSPSISALRDVLAKSPAA